MTTWRTAKEIGYELGVHPATVCYWGRMNLVPVKAKNQRVKLYRAFKRPVHGNAKLTPTQVKWMRRVYGRVPVTVMATICAVTRRTVRCAIKGDTWKRL